MHKALFILALMLPLSAVDAAQCLVDGKWYPYSHPACSGNTVPREPAEAPASRAAAEDSRTLVKDFCYALQAQATCQNLNMRAGTEAKVEKMVGGKLRGPGSIFDKDCLSGLRQANDEQSKGLCLLAWQRYGCAGSIRPRLLQENPFRSKSPVLCAY